MARPFHITLRLGVQKQTGVNVTFDLSAEGVDEALERLMEYVGGARIIAAYAGAPLDDHGPNAGRTHYPELRGRALFAQPLEPAAILGGEAPPLFS